MLNYKLKENVSHGDDLFPIKLYDNDAGMSYRILECHWHDETEFIYMKKGQATFYINTIPYEVRENEVLLINSKDLHMAYSLNHSQCIYESIVFNLEILNSFYLDQCQKEYIYPLLTTHYKFPVIIKGDNQGEQDIISSILMIIEYLSTKVPAYELFIKSLLFKIIALLYNNKCIDRLSYSLNNEELLQSERIRQALSYMNDHYHEYISVDQLCKEVNLSKFYFSRLFKVVTGRSPIDYLNFYRINKAILLLADKDLLISDVAIRVGFDNFSYFTKMFKDYTGLTPSKYRKL